MVSPQPNIMYNEDEEQPLRQHVLSPNQFSTISILFVLISAVLGILSVFDLYYGYTTDSTCVHYSPKGLYLTLKTYLCVQAFVLVLILCVMFISAVVYIRTAMVNTFRGYQLHMFIYAITIFAFIAILFMSVWNILGGILFWGYIYGHDICDQSISTYMFVSLIVKMVGLCLVNQIKLTY